MCIYIYMYMYVFGICMCLVVSRFVAYVYPNKSLWKGKLAIANHANKAPKLAMLFQLDLSNQAPQLLLLHPWILSNGNQRSQKSPQSRLNMNHKLDKYEKNTLPETNIAPKNGWLEYYFPIGEAYFQGPC